MNYQVVEFLSLQPYVMSSDKLIMSDDWTEIEDRIFHQNLKVKFGKG